ncbi:MAG: metallopeptidase family protein [Chloroflexota bacterium]
MMRLSPEEFGQLVDEALETLPAWVGEKMDNVAITVAPWPTSSQLDSVRRQRGPNTMLLGLYEGIPLTLRGRGYHLAAPDRITLFQRPLELHTQDSAQLVRLIQHTIVHEIGHHFGMSEEALRELGL